MRSSLLWDPRENSLMVQWTRSHPTNGTFFLLFLKIRDFVKKLGQPIGLSTEDYYSEELKGFIPVKMFMDYLMLIENYQRVGRW
jgi:hypothetical protein